jgi:hypothetical protein
VPFLFPRSRTCGAGENGSSEIRVRLFESCVAEFAASIGTLPHACHTGQLIVSARVVAVVLVRVRSYERTEVVARLQDASAHRPSR